jgi:hypothetical protein
MIGAGVLRCTALGTARVLGLSALTTVFVAAPAQAHRDDYIDETFVYMTLGQGEFELEFWGEVRESATHVTEGWYTNAFEYGITSRWTLDAAAQLVHQGGGLEFGRLRSETRYRFANEGEWPLDVAASAEYELETKTVTGNETEHTLTPRLVVSKDLSPKLNTTVNLDVPISLSGGGLSFAYGVGVRFPAETTVRVGTEMKGQPSVDTATLFPQVWLALPKGMTIKVGTGIGLTDQTDRFVARGVFEVEF